MNLIFVIAAATLIHCAHALWQASIEFSSVMTRFELDELTDGSKIRAYVHELDSDL